MKTELWHISYVFKRSFKFAHMKYVLSVVLAVLFNFQPSNGQNFSNDVEQLYTFVKKGDQTAAAKVIKKLSEINQDELKKHLDTENKAKAFWLNVYNTFVQYQLKKDPGLFKDRGKFFSAESITIAGRKLSLEDIEHGIIRRSKNKLSQGYVGKMSVNDFEKKFRLEKTDYRVHFALNCGAKSCPPVALYSEKRLEDQLDKSSRLYLKSVAKFNEKENEVLVPKLCSWFKADFGGEDGTIDMLRKYQIIPKDKNPDVKYLDYNWDISLSNYIDL